MTEAPYQVLLYYRYAPIRDAERFAEQHRSFCEELELKGRILIGEEGINGTVSGLVAQTERYMKALIEDERTSGIEFKIDPADGHVFQKLSVKYRPEIVTLGLPGEDDIDPNRVTGKKLSAKEWHEAMQDEDVVIIDGRNDYESALGHFKGAICPDVANFRDFPQWLEKHVDELRGKKVLTYCTGGIRCEKLSGLLLENGIEDVSQLDGGIVKYGKDPEMQGRDYDGLCYVFDQRIAVESNFTETRSVVSYCRKCGEESPRYRNCGWADCNRQFFLCEPCEEGKGRYCSAACEAAAEAAVSS